MKRFISILLIAGVLILMFSCCVKDTQKDKITTAASAKTTTEITETATEHITTTQSMTHADAGEIKIDDGKYRYTIEKTDFEKKYSDDFLLEISKMLPMEYGYENYDKWDATANEILNDATICCDSRIRWWFERFDYDSPQFEAAEKEMIGYGENIKCHEYTVTDISKINDFLIRTFGPDAGVIDKDDFEPYSEIANGEKMAFDDYDYNYRFFYLPESELVVCCINEFSGGEQLLPYICDVQEKDGLYIVKAITSYEGICFNIDTFTGMQSDALNNLNELTYGWLEDWTFTIACDKSGNMYMKNVEVSYILPENAEKNYVVSSDDRVEVKVRKHYTDEWKTVDTLSKNEKVYSPGWYLGEKRIIVTEKYKGVVEPKYLTEIKQ